MDAEAAEVSTWSNVELYDALRECGLSPGPVTETTRAVYVKKLLQLKATRDSTRQSSDDQTKASRAKDETTPCGGGIESNTTSKSEMDSPNTDNQTIPSMVSSPTHLQTVGGGAESSRSKGIVDRLKDTFDYSAHVANDTVFFFDQGEAIFVSRAILVSQCLNLTPVLYNQEDVFPVKVSSLSGQTMEFHAREQELVRDLKEKIYLRLSLRVQQQKLVYRQQELQDSCTLQSYGVGSGSTVHLVMARTQSDSSNTEELVATYSCPASLPNLSIHHVDLNLQPRLLSHQPHPSLPQHTRLSSHLTHIVHIQDGHYAGFKQFLYFLYTNTLLTGSATTGGRLIENCAVCWVLAERYCLPALVEECQAAMGPLMTSDKAHLLATYAEAVRCPSLLNYANKFLSN